MKKESNGAAGTSSPAFPQPLVNKPEAAAWMNCSVRTLEYYMAEKIVPFIRLRGKKGRVKFDLAVLAQHMKGRMRLGS